MKFPICLVTLAISTVAAAHCMKKGQELSASFISEPSDVLFPGSNLVYYCSDKDLESSVSMINLDVIPALPTAEDYVRVSISGILSKPFNPDSYVTFRDVVTGKQLYPEHIKICPFLESLGRSCPIGSLTFQMDFEFLVGSLPDVSSNDIYIELYEPDGEKIMCVKSPYYLKHAESEHIFMDGIGAADL